MSSLSNNSERAWWLRPLTLVVPMLVSVTVTILHSRTFLPFFADDAFISLRYAERLIEGKGLTWTEGRPVEGYTNLLWILFCAGLGAVGIDLVDAARYCGQVGTGAAVVATIAFVPLAQITPFSGGAARSFIATMLCGLMVALTPAVAVWTIGGLEQPLVMALLAAGLVAVFRVVERPNSSWPDVIMAGVALGCLCLTRADGAVLGAGITAGLIFSRSFSAERRKHLLFAAGLAILIFLGQLVFRRVYYGEYVPNSAYVKVAFTTDRLMDGLRYFAAAMPYWGGLFFVVLITIIDGLRRRTSRRFSIVIGATFMAWCAHVLIVGGDIFPAHRHLLPLVPLAALLVGTFLSSVETRHFVIRAAIVAVALAWLAIGTWIDPAVQRARDERWEWDGKALAEVLRNAFGSRRPLLACEAAGCLPYYSKFPSLDMLGLNDYHIARQRTSEFGHSYLGHELGDGKYVLDQEPDIVIFWLTGETNEPVFRSGKELMGDPRFVSAYRFLTLLIRPDPLRKDAYPPEGMFMQIWVRTTSDKIGVQRGADWLEIPGYLAMTSISLPAVPGADGRLAVRAHAVDAAVFDGIRLEPGRWRLSVDSEGPVSAEILSKSTILPVSNELQFVVAPESSMIEVHIRARGTRTTLVRSIRFEQVPSAG